MSKDIKNNGKGTESAPEVQAQGQVTEQTPQPPQDIMYKFIIPANLKQQELEKVSTRIAETTTIMGTLPPYLQDAIKTQLLRLEYEKKNLEQDSNPQVLNRIAFTNFIHTLPKGLLGEGTVIINCLADGWNVSIAEPRKRDGNGNGTSEVPAWSTYGYGFTAQSICDRLGIYVGGASANTVLYHHAKKQGKTVQDMAAVITTSTK